MPDDIAPNPEAFLAGLGEALRTREGTDRQLAAILAQQLLTDKPTSNAVETATKAIKALAQAKAIAALRGPDA